MKYTLDEILTNKDSRETAAKLISTNELFFVDGNGVFSIDFNEDSVRSIHRNIYDRLAELGGDKLLKKILPVKGTCLTDDPNAVKVGVCAIEGSKKYYLKANASAVLSLASIAAGIAGWAKFADDFDIDAVYFTDDAEDSCEASDEDEEGGELIFDFDDDDTDFSFGDMFSEDIGTPINIRYTEPRNFRIAEQDGQFIIWDNDTDAPAQVFFTDGPSTDGWFPITSVPAMIECQLVSEEHPEYGWKFMIDGQGSIWGWIHPEFRQIIAPMFSGLFPLEEGSSGFFMAVTGYFTNAEGLFVFSDVFGTNLLEKVELPDNFKEFAYDFYDKFYCTDSYALRTDHVKNRSLLTCKSIGHDSGKESRTYFFWSKDKFAKINESGNCDHIYNVRFKNSVSFGNGSVNAPDSYCYFGCNCPLTMDMCEYISSYSGPYGHLLHYHIYSNSSISTKPHVVIDDSVLSLHWVQSPYDPKLFALAAELFYGNDDRFSEERYNLTPYEYTDIELAYPQPKDITNTTYRRYFIVTRGGKRGLLLADMEHFLNCKAKLCIPCDYDDISVNSAGVVTVRRMNFVGELDLEGKWLVPLHREEA